MPNIIGNVLNGLLSDISINFFNNHKYYLTQGYVENEENEKYL